MKDEYGEEILATLSQTLSWSHFRVSRQWLKNREAE